VVVDGRGVAFFGPSGAGKSTIAGTSPYPVLSDEMVAIVPAHVVSGRPPLWAAALASIGHVARGVPVMRLAWNPAEPPWDRTFAAHSP
jgi:hypothetical protein